MVIAALASFAILVVAWILAPSQPPTMTMVEPSTVTPEAEPIAA